MPSSSFSWSEGARAALSSASVGGGSQEETRRWVRERERAAWAKRREGRSRGSVEWAMSEGGMREDFYFYDLLS